MPIYHMACHGYKRKPTAKEMVRRTATFHAAFDAAPCVEEEFLGHCFGSEDGYHDAVCIRFKDLETCRSHMSVPHVLDEATHVRENVEEELIISRSTPSAQLKMA